MTAVPIAQAVDEIATRNPAQLGFGYADTQHPWYHDPAFDLPRALAQTLAQRLRRCHPQPVVLLAGTCGRGALHHLVRCFARRTVTIDGDGARMAKLAQTLPAESVADVLIPHRPDAPSAAAALAALAGGVDALVLDGLQDQDDARCGWQSLHPLVRPGGLIAIVDRSQTGTGDDEVPGVDEFVHGLQAELLMPAGVQLERLGGACAVHLYHQTVALRGARPVHGERERCARSGDVPAEHRGFLLQPRARDVIAVPAAEGPFAPERLRHNGYGVVLLGEDRVDAAATVDAWLAMEATLGEVLDHLEQRRLAAALDRLARVRREHPLLVERLTAAVEAAPWCRRTLIALGLLLLEDAPQQGLALLRRALQANVLDGRLLQVAAAVCLDVLGDQGEARSLLDECRLQVRRRKVAQLCTERLQGSVLRHFPQLLAEVRSVVHVGAHRGQAVADWLAFQIGRLCLIEANPAVLPALRKVAATVAAPAAAVVIEAAVGEAPGEGRLLVGEDDAGASLREHHALAQVPPARRQTQVVPVQVTTLDALLRSGAIDPAHCDLLVIDTEGSELDVLRGARELLQHVELVCVNVCLAPLYVDAPLLQKLQGHLHDVLGDDGFGLCGFDPTPDGSRGQALFRRLRRCP